MVRIVALLAMTLLGGCATVAPPPVLGAACPAASADRPVGLTMSVRVRGASLHVEGPGLATECSNGFGWARCSVAGPVLARLDSPAGRTVYDIPAQRRATLTYAGGQNRCVLT